MAKQGQELMAEQPKAKMLNPVTSVLHCLKIKNSLFQQIVMKMCSRSSAALVKAQIDKAKQSGGNGKEINEISEDTLVNLLNISGETYDAAQSVVQEVENLKFHLLLLPLTD